MGGRLISTAFLLPAAAGLMWLDHERGEPAPVLFLLLLAVGLRATWELIQLFPPPAAPPAPDDGSPPDYYADPEAARPSFAVAGIGVTLALLGAWAPHWLVRTVPPTLPPSNVLTGLGAVAAGLAAAVIVAAVRRVSRFDHPGGHAAGLAAEVFAAAYVGGLLAVAAQLRWVAGAGAGYLAIGSLMFAAKAGDTGAYLTGRAFGRAKLIPRVSPGKTWAGAVGAVVWAAAVAAGWLWLAGALVRAGRVSPRPGDRVRRGGGPRRAAGRPGGKRAEAGRGREGQRFAAARDGRDPGRAGFAAARGPRGRAAVGCLAPGGVTNERNRDRQGAGSIRAE